jgi:phosphoribosylformylglycinamidine synthase
MKAYVYVSLKKSVLDPQGKTIQGALHKMGYKGLQDVRQGGYFELSLNGGFREQAKTEVEWIAREVLTNPVIEEFLPRRVVIRLGFCRAEEPSTQLECRSQPSNQELISHVALSDMWGKRLSRCYRGPETVGISRL